MNNSTKMDIIQYKKNTDLAYWLAKKEYGEHLLQKGKFKVNASKAWEKWKKDGGEHLVGERTFRGWFNKKHPFELS